MLSYSHLSRAPFRPTHQPAYFAHHPTLPPTNPPACPPTNQTRFSSGKLRFGAFDVSIWPRAAAEVRMTCNTWSNQLPAVVLYEKGKEWGRLPPVGSDPSKRNYYRTVGAVRRGVCARTHGGLFPVCRCMRQGWVAWDGAVQGMEGWGEGWTD